MSKEMSKKDTYDTITLLLMCSLSREGVLPNWAYYIDWMGDEAGIFAQEMMMKKLFLLQTKTLVEIKKLLRDGRK